jgi:dihydroneopterin aldolase
MKDKIIVKGLHCSVRLGVRKEEQEVRRNCEVDLVIHTDLAAAARSDNLDETINYSKVIDLIQKLSTDVRYRLLESFAYRIFEEIFRKTTARRVTVRIKKINPPIEAHFDYVGVQLTRDREDFFRD